MQIKKNKLKEKFQKYESYISFSILYLITGFIIKWYNNCKNFFIPILFWPYMIIDYLLKLLESDVPTKYCYSFLKYS